VVRSRRGPAALAALLLLPILGAALAPAERPFKIKGDEATYVEMALSIAYDGDLRFTATDLHRFEEMFGTGPTGIFLQRPRDVHVTFTAGWPPVRITRTPRSSREGLAFGKPFVYPVVAAPFVRIGGLRGLLFLNLLLLSAMVWMAWTFAATRTSPVAAALVAVAFAFASILPIYAVWRTPEMLNSALVFGGYFLWLYKQVASEPALTSRRWLAHPATDFVAAAFLGLATYSKPPNALLIAPVVLTMLVAKRWRHAIVVGTAFLLLSAGAFAVNGLIAGEMNYQGGVRSTFTDSFPYSDPTVDPTTAFEHAGTSMVTEHSDAQQLLAPAVFVPLFEHNTEYFLIGRDAGFVPYFFPGLVILVAWLARPRSWTRWQVLVALALGASILVMLALAPYSWNGGGGPPGNRYLLSLYPAFFFLLPSRFTGRAAAVSLLGLAVTGPLLLRPLAASYGPWHNVEHGVVRLLPIELTLADDLPVRLNLARSRLDLDNGLLYLMDENAFMPEAGKRFWVAGAARAEMILRTDRAIEKATLHLHSVVANHVTISLGRGRASIDLQPDGDGTLVMEPGPGVVYRESRAYVFTVTTTNGFVPADVDPKSQDRRFLGVFIEPTFQLVN
jgi:hypothetical protein